MKRTLFFLYGVVCYAATVASLVYAAGFLANIGVPKSIDSTPTVGLWKALLIDLGLLGVFAVQHSVMARQGFKRLLVVGRGGFRPGCNSTLFQRQFGFRDN